MIDLSAVPVWIIPGIIVFLFGLGVGVNRFVSNHVTPKQLEQRIEKCVHVQGRELHEIRDDVKRLTSEREEIWNLVRETEQRTKVLTEAMEWVKNGIQRIEGKL